MRLFAPILALTLATQAHGGTVRVEQSVNGGGFTLHSNWTTAGGTVNITLNNVAVGNDIVVFRVRDVDAGALTTVWVLSPSTEPLVVVNCVC